MGSRLNDFASGSLTENSNDDVISKLEQIKSLLEEKETADYYANYGYVREVQNVVAFLKKELGELPKRPSVFDKLPFFVERDADFYEEEEWYKKKKSKADKAIPAAIVLFALAVISFFLGNGALSIIFIIVGVCLYSSVSTDRKRIKTIEQEHSDAEKKQQDTMIAFDSALSQYFEEKKAAMEAYSDYYVRCCAFHATYMDQVSKCFDERSEALATVARNTEAIESYGFVPPEYYHYVPTVITLLKSGRADSYKEALNMAIADEKAAEIEMQRQREEEERNQILARRAREERRHNEALEMQNAQHNKAMENMEQERLYAEERAREQAKYDAKKEKEEQAYARQNAMHTCRKCSKFQSCYNHGTVGCGAFTPR